MRVAIIDYGAGNIHSVQAALAAAGAETTLARDPASVLAADRLVLPGVGAAGAAMSRLRSAGLAEALTEAVRQRGRPLLGICLGMQLIAGRLLEFGRHEGLGWVEGEVANLRDVCTERVRIPHMGWSVVEPEGSAAAFFAVPERQRTFYFCHSFTLTRAAAGVVAARTTYGAPLVAAVLDGSVFATQFHPEKSQINGQRLLKTFLAWRP